MHRQENQDHSSYIHTILSVLSQFQQGLVNSGNSQIVNDIVASQIIPGHQWPHDDSLKNRPRGALTYHTPKFLRILRNAFSHGNWSVMNTHAERDGILLSTCGTSTIVEGTMKI